MRRFIVVTALALLAGCAADGSPCPIGRPCPGWSAQDQQQLQQQIQRSTQDFNAQQQEAQRLNKQRQHELRMQRERDAAALQRDREREAAAQQRAQKEIICESRTENGVTRTVCK